jgi:hypothetical protein
MEEATLKLELYDKIEHADIKQLKEIYGLIIDYFDGQEPLGEWDSLPEYQKERIEESIRQADAGLGTPARDIIQRTREKYGLNG